MSDANMTRAAIHAALQRIGHHNGHACPAGASNNDPALHEYMVATEGEAYFKKRREQARDDLIKQCDGKAIDNVVTNVTKTKVKQSAVLLSTSNYTLTLDVAAPSKRLDEAALRNKLQTEHGMSADDVAKLIDACKKPSAPAKSYKVSASF
jgi:hypothetical protein